MQQKQSAKNWSATTFEVVLGAVGLLMSLWPSIRTRGAFMPGDPGDVRYVHYVLEHGYRWISGSPAHASLWNPPFFYPASNMLAYSDTMLGSAPFYWVWRVLGIGADPSFLLWLMTLLVLGYVLFLLLLKRSFGLRPLPSAFGAFLFAFGSPRIMQLNHPQLMQQFWFVLALHAAIQLFVAQRSPDRTGGSDRRVVGWIALFTVSVSAQFWSSFYLGWFFAIGCGIGLMGCLRASPRREALLRLWGARKRALLTASVLGALSLAPLAYHYALAARELPPREFGQVNPWIPMPSSWTFLGETSWMYGWMRFYWPWRELVERGIAHEHSAGIGWLTTGLALAGLFGLRRASRVARAKNPIAVSGFAAARRVTAIGLIFFVAITKFFPHVSLWGILYGIVPGASAIRAISRVSLITLVPVSLGLAYFLERASGRGTWRRRHGLPMALGLLCVLEQGHRLPHYDGAWVSEQVDSLAANIREEVAEQKGCEAFFYVPRFIPYSLDNPYGSARRMVFNQSMEKYAPWKHHLDAMWASLRLDIKSVNGYSGNFPPHWSDSMFQIAILSPSDTSRLKLDLKNWEDARQVPPSSVCWISPQVSEE
jgi:hypothetical protein